MAGTITFSGLSSGLDTSSWIDALVSVKQSTISSLQDKLTIQQNIQNVVLNIKSFFTSFQSCLQKITDSQFGVANMDVFAQNIVNSSNINIATASATTEAARQSYDVLVEQLATYTKAKSGYKDVEVIKANLDTTLGQLGMKKGTITVGTGSFSVTEDDTIRDLVAKFNSIGVTASFDEPKAKLTVNTDVNNIDDGSTKLKSVFGLENNPTQITVPKPGGSLTTPEHIVTIYADGNTLLSELGITDDMSYTAYDNNDTALASNISNLSGLTINEFVAQLNTNGLNASFDEENHKISINNGYITGTLADALGISKQTVSTSTVATTESTLADIGITEKKTLSINGGEAVEYDTDTKLSDIMSAITTAGGSASLVDGNLTVSGVQLSGTLVDALGLVETGETTSITSGTLEVTVYTTTTSTDKLYTSETLGISWDTKLGEILGEDTTALGFYIDGSEKSYTTATKLSDIKSDIIAAGGTMELDTENNKITISGVEVSGTLATAFGLTNPTYTTSISSNTPVYVGGSSGNADSNTKLVDVGVAEGTYSINIFDEAGTSKYSNSNFSVQSDTTVGDFLSAVNSALGTGSATISDGVITITNGYVTGTLAEALGIGTENIITGVTMTSSQLSYYGYEPSDWIGEIEIASGTGSIAVSSGTIISGVTGGEHIENFIIGTTYKSAFGATDIMDVDESFTTGATYAISSAEGLIHLGFLINEGADTTGVNFVLTDDIDLSTTSNFGPIGTSSNPFKGNFYGNGHVISNLTINSTNDYIGLFGFTNIDSVIQDLGLENVNITGENYTGALAGSPSGIITNCYVSGGTVSGTSGVGGLVGVGHNVSYSYANVTVSGTDNVGGLVGLAIHKAISHCYATGNVTGTGNNVGGFVGLSNPDSNITHSYATGNVSGSEYVGGFAGSIYNFASQCYAIGTVTGTGSSVGGFVGNSSGILTSCVYNSGTGLSSGASGDVAGLTLAQMQTQSTMEGYGFTAANGWGYTSGNTPGLGNTAGVITKVIEVSEFKSGNVYHISTAADLQRLSELVNAGADTTGVTFILDHDIPLSPYANFTPIGNNSSNAFNGTFYGNGHAIKNLTINGNSDFTGLFGCTGNSSVIQDLGLENVNITGGRQYTGALAGRSEGDIINCYVSDGTVRGTNYVGGLVGFQGGGSISYSYTDVTVSGSKYVGGLVGDASNVSIYIENCYAVGNVTGTGDCVGGLIGYGIIAGLTNSYATGNVTGGNYVGGLIGQGCNTPISNCYSTGTVTGTGSNVGGFVGNSTGTLTNCVYNSGTGLSSGASSGVTELSLLEIKTQSVMEGYGFTAENGWTYTANTTPNFGNYTGSVSGLTMYVSDLTGFTSGDTYHISTAADLQRLAELVNAGNDTTGVRFILDNNIDLSSVENFTPIGTSSKEFKGEFYGNGHVISNLTIDSSSIDTGLFGYTSGATIQDLGVVDANITSTKMYAGILVGSAEDSTITNCYTTGSVTCTGSSVVTGAAVGGLVGFNSSSNFTNSYSTADVTGYQYVGGLVGNGNGTYTNCYATGSVTASNSYAGGFIGYSAGGNTTITNCYSTGDVSGANYIGGFVGSLSTSYTHTIEQSYSTGNVTTTGSSKGGFIGSGGSSATCTNCVYNSDTGLSAGDGISSGVTGLSLAQMKDQSIMEGYGFTTENGWYYYEGQAPRLQAPSDNTINKSASIQTTLGMLNPSINSGGVTLGITNDGTNLQNHTFYANSTIEDVINWINELDIGVTASFNEDTHTISVTGNNENFAITGDAWNTIYNAGIGSTTNSTQTNNTPSRTLTYTTSDTKIDENTTVGDLMDAASGTFNITIGDFSGNYGCSTTLSTVLNDINNSGNGYTASIVDGVFSVSGNGQFNISGDLGLKLYGENGSTTHNPTYISDTLSSTTSTVADGNTTLAELGVNSGNFRITDKDGNLITTIDITDSMKISDLNSAISGYGTVSITDGKVTATLNGAYRLEDGTSNLITKLKFNTYSDNTSTLTTTSTLAQMGFGAGGTIEVSIDGVAQTPISFDGSEDMSDIISRLNALGITASVSDGKFTATSGHEFTLGGNLGNYLVSGSANGYVATTDGYITDSPLIVNDDRYTANSNKLTYNTLLTETSTLESMGFSGGGTLKITMGSGDVHDLTFTKDKTMQDIIDELDKIGIKTEINNGEITFTCDTDTFSFSGSIGNYFNQGTTSESGGTEDITVNYAVGKDDVGYETETISSVASYADGATLLSDLNITKGDLSIFIDGVKSTVHIEENDTFKTLFDKIVSETGAKGVTVKAGFVTTDGDIAASPEKNKNTGVIAIQAEGEHTVFIGASNDTTNFTTIANIRKTENDNLVKGTKALYKVNTNSIITEEGLFKTGKVTEGKFYIGDAEFTIDSTTTLNDLIKQINYNEKSYASAYWDTLSGTLVLTSKLSGNSMINIESDSSNFTEIMGFTKTDNGKETLVIENQTGGQNAQVRINGTLVTSATNIITSDISRIKGLTINLKGLSNGEHTTITVEQDKDNIYNAVSEVVDSYNALMENFEKEVSTGGTLASDSNMKLFKNSLKRNMTKSLSSSALYRNLMSVGISTGKAQDSITTDVTSLIIDKDKFMECLDSNPDEIKNLLVGTKDNSGLFVDIENMVERAISQSGIITITENRLNNNIESYNKKISAKTLALNKYRARLETKFKNMESIISNLQNSYNGLLSQSA